jgi:hypothetical protein
VVPAGVSPLAVQLEVRNEIAHRRRVCIINGNCVRNDALGNYVIAQLRCFQSAVAPRQAEGRPIARDEAALVESSASLRNECILRPSRTTGKINGPDANRRSPKASNLYSVPGPVLAPTNRQSAKKGRLLSRNVNECGGPAALPCSANFERSLRQV